MAKYKVLIVDDELEARNLLIHYLKHLPDCTLVGVCKNAVSALQVISEQSVDLLFVDIHMPGLSGVELAKSIPSHIKVIFTTAHREYAVEGFELMIVDYLLKPISLDRFLRAVYKFIRESKSEQDTKQNFADKEEFREFMFVRSERRMVKIAFSDILYVESLQDYLKIHLKNEVLVVRETLAKMKEHLGNKRFMRCHRSFIVGVQHISSYTNEYLTVGQNIIPISRSNKEQVISKLQDLSA